MTNDPTSAAYEELKQKLADIEHQRWSDWQNWVHKVFLEGNFREFMLRWQRQIATPYSELSEQEQASDMEQVDRYWPLIKQAIVEAETRGRIDELEQFKGWVDRLHYQPVNEQDRWSLAAGEIVAEANERIKSLQANADGANGRDGEDV